MKAFTSSSLIATSLLTLLLGCERAARDDASKPTNASPAVPTNVAIAPAGTNRVAGVTNASMIPIPAGRFTMGDKDEVDASPHEVSVSAFYLDTHLVTQEQYQKAMGVNP